MTRGLNPWSHSCATAPDSHRVPRAPPSWWLEPNGGVHSAYCGMDLPRYAGLMKVDKMSISLDAELGDAVREAARRAGKGLSSWLAEAASAKLRAEALEQFLDDWEREHGPLTPAELQRAERELGLRAADPVA